MGDDSGLDDDTNPAPALGWDADDLCMLQELAQLGMILARELVEDVQEHNIAVANGQAERRTQPQAAAAAISFARISRAVRMSLALKAHALGDRPASGRGAGPTRPQTWWDSAIVDFDCNDPDMPDVEDLEARADFRCRRVRDQLDHAISDPRHPPGEVERLRETLAARLEVEREREHFLERSAPRLVERIALDLGLSGVWRPTKTPDGRWGNDLIARPGEDEKSEAIPQPAGMPHYTTCTVGWDRDGPEPPPKDCSWRIPEEGAVALADLARRIREWREKHGPNRKPDTS
jgi:hypothetical protein